MSVIHPGTAYLNARALLEHPRIKHHDVDTFVTFDAIISCKYATKGSLIVCSLSYRKKRENENVRVGIYDIYAKVVSYKPQTHDASPVRRDNEFKLMGDILHLFRVSPVTTPVTLYRTPPRLSISGKITDTQQDIRTFTMTMQQTIRWAAPNTILNIRGALGMRAMWPPLDQHLPVSNSVVSFTGDLVGFEFNVALLALDDLCYLPAPGRYV